MMDYDEEQCIKINNIIEELKKEFGRDIFVDKINSIYFVEIKIYGKISFGLVENRILFEAFKESMGVSIENWDDYIIIGIRLPL